jgi:hypothetical protein
MKIDIVESGDATEFNDEIFDFEQFLGHALFS